MCVLLSNATIASARLFVFPNGSLRSCRKHLWFLVRGYLIGIVQMVLTADMRRIRALKYLWFREVPTQV